MLNFNSKVHMYNQNKMTQDQAPFPKGTTKENNQDYSTAVKDILTISEESKIMAEMFRDFKNPLSEMIKQLEESKNDKKGDDTWKYYEIARRIARGDKVPPSDEKKLMEFNPGLYQIAKLAATTAKNKVKDKHRPLFEDEEDNHIQAQPREESMEKSQMQIISEASSSHVSE
ncbi:MAG: hypothetical protein WC983_02295 [Tissierellaceae bacterium]